MRSVRAPIVARNAVRRFVRRVRFGRLAKELELEIGERELVLGSSWGVATAATKASESSLAVWKR
jgi:hypothetical protein